MLLRKMSFVIGKGEQKLRTIRKVFIKWPADVKAKINAIEVNHESIKKRNCCLLRK